MNSYVVLDLLYGSKLSYKFDGDPIEMNMEQFTNLALYQAGYTLVVL